MVAVCLAVGILGAQKAHAGTAFWDVNGSNAGAGGPAATGTWDGSTANWNPLDDGTGSVAVWNGGDTAVFSAGSDATGGFNVTVSGTQSAGGITFEEGKVTLNSGEIDFPAAGAINIASGVTGTVGTTVIGGTSLAVTGPGTFRLNSSSSTVNNKFTGGITISGGATLSFPGELNTDQTKNGGINPLGIIPSAAVANYITLDGGTISNTVATGTSFLLANRGVTLGANGGTFDITGTNAKLTYAGIITGSSRIAKTGPGSLTLTVSNQNTGGWKISGGTLLVGSPSALAALGPVPGGTVADYIILDGGNLTQTQTANGGRFTDTTRGIELTANGGGVGAIDNPDHTTSQNSQYQGLIALAPGVTSATLHKVGDGEFRANNPAGWTFTKLEVDGGFYRVTTASSGISATSDAMFGTVPQQYDASAILLSGTGADRSHGGVAIGTSATITTPSTRGVTINSNGATFITNANWTIQSIVTGAGGLTLNENGWAPTSATSGFSLILTGANTYLGATKINAGTLEVQGGSAIPDTSAVTISSASTSSPADTKAILLVDNDETIGSLAGGGGTGAGSGGQYGTVILKSTLTTGANNTNTTFSGIIDGFNGAGALTKTGTGLMALGANNTYPGQTTINMGTLQLGTGGTSGSVQNDVTNNGVLAFKRSDNVTFSHTISGSGSVVQSGTGTTLLANDNSYTGGTSVQAGTLSVASDAKLGDTTVAAGVALAGGGTLEASSSFSTGRAITTGTGGGGISVDGGQVLTASTAITGTGNLSIGGAGQLVTPE